MPGIVFVQLDGVAHDRAASGRSRSGDVPNARTAGCATAATASSRWETGWSSQTGVSQCGILHGSTADMPAFRWVDKATGAGGRLEPAEVARRRSSGAHSDGNGLLAHHGSSYGNLFSGDAERAVLTMSGIARRKEGRIGAGYVGYFSRPAAGDAHAASASSPRSPASGARRPRSAVAASSPACERGWTYALLRAFTTVISRDVSRAGRDQRHVRGARRDLRRLARLRRGRRTTPGPERADTLAVLRDLDRQIGRIERAARAGRRGPYQLVVLSDHGQTQGATVRTSAPARRSPSSSAGCAAARRVRRRRRRDRARTESTAWLRRAAPTPTSRRRRRRRADVPIVLGSGSLGLVYLPGRPAPADPRGDRRALPRADPRAGAHPGIGFVLVGAEPAGRRGARRGRRARTWPPARSPVTIRWRRSGRGRRPGRASVDAYRTVADLMINSRYDPERDEVAAFEDQVGSHGGLGGPQTHPFLLYPTTLSAPQEPIFTLAGGAPGAQGLARRGRRTHRR